VRAEKERPAGRLLLKQKRSSAGGLLFRHRKSWNSDLSSFLRRQKANAAPAEKKRLAGHVYAISIKNAYGNTIIVLKDSIRKKQM
jgi:hypothetical protein